MKRIKAKIKVVSRENNVIDTIKRSIKIGLLKNPLYGLHYVRYKNKKYQVYDMRSQYKLKSLAIYPWGRW